MDNKLSKSVEKNLNRAGRKPGVPNKATQEAREAVKAILDGNLPFIQSWIQQTAEGIVDEDGKFIVLPNPGKACDIVQNMVEYAVPKLARTEVVGDAKAPQRMVVSWKK
jgi:tRNA1(Val) A37 N6-methylase TrmN6